MRRSGSLGVADGDAVALGVGDGDGEVCELGRRLALAVALAVALAETRGPSLGRRGPPESASATTVPVRAASAIITA